MQDMLHAQLWLVSHPVLNSHCWPLLSCASSNLVNRTDGAINGLHWRAMIQQYSASSTSECIFAMHSLCEIFCSECCQVWCSTALD